MSDKKRGIASPSKPITPPKPPTSGVQGGVPPPSRPIAPPKK